jgi:hypothetical protein
VSLPAFAALVAAQLDAHSTARIKIERDLRDGVQQRPIALRMK